MNANIINQIGSLTDLLSELESNSIHRFESLKDIIAFRSNTKSEILRYKLEQEINLTKTISAYKSELLSKTAEFQYLIVTREAGISAQKDRINNYLKAEQCGANLFTRYCRYIKRKYYQYENKRLSDKLENDLTKLRNNEKLYIQNISNKIQNAEKLFDETISEEVAKYEKRITRILEVLNNLNPLFVGAIGEQKALNELSKLSDEYYVINDFKMNFSPPIYNKQENDRICSIQIDHVVFGPTGIFIIETKNWSNKSIASLDLFSPVKQIRRSGFALFCYLNDLIRRGRLNTFSSHWGEYKISIKNLLLMVGATTREQFQYIKIIDLQHLIADITRKDIVFDQDQIKEILRSLISPEY